MEVRVLDALPTSACPDKDYVCVHTDTDPLDDTVVLATIERVTDRTKGETTTKRVKTLVTRARMSIGDAVGLARRYAEWKEVPVVYTDAAGVQTHS